MDDLPAAEVKRLCREWKCSKCARSPEQIQQDLNAANPALPMHKRAHDWTTQRAAQAAQGGE